MWRNNTSPGKNRSQRLTKLFVGAVFMLGAVCGRAEEFLFDGTFETGSFQGWTPGGTNGGFAVLAVEGNCFSANDTTGITIAGTFAALLRSNPRGNRDSIGTITSDPFQAGSAISFRAVSESRDGRNARTPVTLEVRVLDESGELLQGHSIVQTSVARLKLGCPSERRNGAFRRHIIDTSLWIGQTIRIELAQHTNVAGEGFFTLIDDITFFGAGEQPILPDQPVAVAGTSLSNGGFIRLDGRESFHTGGQEMDFEWFVPGDSTPRTGQTVSLSDLEDGQEYRVILFVNDGVNFSSDVLQVGIPQGVNDRDGDTDDGSTTDLNADAAQDRDGAIVDDNEVAPTLTSISPVSGTRPPTQQSPPNVVAVTLTGTNLTGATAVDVSGDGVSVSNVVVVNDTTVTATFSIARDPDPTGAHDVSVTTPGGTSGSVIFTVN
ncbi:MAG: hypothetical protein OEQ18_03325 [Gammaproteobacteria bacterium]|nr:hypothetical protein [Gammaproteobacteria bacterium]